MAASRDPATGTASPPRDAPPGARWALGASTAVSWFLLAGLAIVIGAAESAAYAVLQRAPEASGGVGPAGLLALLALATPALPLGAWWGRERLATRSASAALLGGVLLTAAHGPWLVAAGMVTCAAASFFLVAVVGLANRRAVAGGLAGAFVLRELVRIALPAGSPSLATLLSAALVAAFGAWCLQRWRRAPGQERGEGFERRAGGLRLRGALALGALLFLELSLGLGTRVALSPWAAPLSMGAASLAWLLVVRGIDVKRHRALAVVLAAVAAAGAVLPTLAALDASASLAALVLAHAAALLLLDRALAPVSGRRTGGNLAAGLLLLGLLSTGAVTGRAALADGMVSPFLSEAAWASLAGVILAITMYLTPRPPAAAPALPNRLSLPLAALLPLLAAVLAAVRA